MNKLNFAQVTTVVRTVGKFYKDHKHAFKTGAKYIFGGGAVAYAVIKAPKTIHDLEDAGEKKGEPLTFGEKASIVFKNQYPAMIMGSAAIASDISLAVDAGKETKALKEENTSLIGQIAEIGNAYNTVNAVKEAMTKKVEEEHGKETVKEIRAEAVKPTVNEQIASIPPAERAYVFDRERLEHWNDIYLREGNVDFKIQEYFIPLFGQSILSCNYEIFEADKRLNRLKSSETGKGFINGNDVLNALHARNVSPKLGDNVVWRDHYETFSIIPREMNLDGSAVFCLDFFSDFYYDREGEYYD